MNRLHRLIRFSLLTLLLIPALADAESGSRQPTITHHRLAVQLFPESHQLIAIDEVTIGGGSPGQEMAYSLNPTLRIERIVDATACRDDCSDAMTVAFERTGEPDHPELQRVLVKRPVTHLADQAVRLKFFYRGTIDDPPRDPRHLRFVTPSETSGHIGAEGVYLSSESQWYPDLEDSLPTYDVTVSVPEGWSVVTQGTQQPDGVSWVAPKSEALTIVANRFVVKSRAWQAKSGQAIQLATYLFPEDAALADEYLDASARYLDAYIPLLGHYPFSQFAVVENFFPSGLGMPSFTLLGSGVIKRHYTQPYALGHEIVHSWIGNGVFNRVSQGNWVEGLTTYLSNYYYHELTGDEAQAREQRRLMLLGYSVHVHEGDDYPLGKFVQKRNEKDNAIGYQKSAMVFHLLRQEIGERPFWRALKQISERYLGKVADWNDLERVFQDAADRDLRWFFAQWIEEAGAPTLELSGLRVQPVHGTSSHSGSIAAAVHVAQPGTPYRVPVELEFVLNRDRSQAVRIQMADANQEVIVPLLERPLAVRLDPDYHLFRRVPRHQIAPMLNLYVTDTSRTIILPSTMPSEQPGPLGEIVQRIVAQEAAKPDTPRTSVLQPGADVSEVPRGSLLLLGHTRESRIAATALHYCGDHVRLTENGFSVEGRKYEGPGMALLASCRRDDQPGSVVTFLYGVTPDALSRVARLLFFYGWQSYVVFQEGTVTARGDWEDRMSAEVRFDTD